MPSTPRTDTVSCTLHVCRWNQPVWQFSGTLHRFWAHRWGHSYCLGRPALRSTQQPLAVPVMLLVWLQLSWVDCDPPQPVAQGMQCAPRCRPKKKGCRPQLTDNALSKLGDDLRSCERQRLRMTATHLYSDCMADCATAVLTLLHCVSDTLLTMLGLKLAQNWL